MIWKVWTDDWNEESGAKDVEAPSARCAAEEFLDRWHSHLDYPTEQEVVVMAPGGHRTRWVVYVSQEPVFHASQIEQKVKEDK